MRKGLKKWRKIWVLFGSTFLKGGLL